MEDHSRYSIVEAAPLEPGVCWVTKTPNGPLIDTGVDILFNERGRLYLSVEAIKEMAERAGLFETDVELDVEVEAYSKGYADGVKEDLSGHLDRGIDQLDFLVDTLRTIRLDRAVLEEPTGVPEGADEPVVDTPESEPVATDGGAGQVNRPARQRRRADVPATPSNESFRL